MRTATSLILAMPLLALLACTKGEESTAPAAEPTPISAAVLQVLAKADALDGQVDQIVHRCAGCALGMDGKEEFALPVGDYTMHFCKKACIEAFRPDPGKQILTLKLKD